MEEVDEGPSEPDEETNEESDDLRLHSTLHPALKVTLTSSSGSHSPLSEGLSPNSYRPTLRPVKLIGIEIISPLDLACPN